MAMYEVSIRTTLATATAAATLASFRGDTAERNTVREIHIFTTNGVSGGIGLARSTALSSGTLTSVAAVPHDPVETASAALGITAATTAMATNGGIGAVFRRFDHSAAIGNGVVWTFDMVNPLVLALGSAAASGELCFVNLNAATPALYDITVVYGE